MAFNLLKEDGFAVLKEDGGHLLLDLATVPFSWNFQPSTSATPAICRAYPNVCYGTGTVTGTSRIDSAPLALTAGETYTNAVSVSTDFNTTAQFGVYDQTAGAWVGATVSVAASTSVRSNYTFTAPAAGHTCVFRMTSVAVDQTEPQQNVYWNGDQVEYGSYATAYTSNTIGHTVSTLPLVAMAPETTAATTKVNTAIDSTNTVIATSLDFTRPYKNMGTLARKNAVDLGSDVSAPLSYANQSPDYRTMFDGSGNFNASSALTKNLPNAAAIYTDFALWTSATGSGPYNVSYYFDNHNGGAVTFYVPTYTTTVGDQNFIPGTTVGCVGPGFTTAAYPQGTITGIVSGHTLYFLIYYTKSNGWNFTVQDNTPFTMSQIQAAYADGGRYVVIATTTVSGSGIVINAGGTAGGIGSGGGRPVK